jgi:hypothetical protein
MINTTKRKVLLGAALPVLLAALGTAACHDTLPTAAQPQGTLNSTSLANKQGVEGTLVSAYRALDYNETVGGAWGNAASDWVWASTSSDDALKGSSQGDQGPIQDVGLYNWGTANVDGYLNDKWRGVYEGVARSNAVLNLLASVQKNSPGQIAASDAASIAGEALFLRAHYHFSAYRVFGNIPYYRESDTDFRKANEPAAQVLTDIMKDLDSAATLLPTTPRGGDKGRAFKSTALAYKGRVQAYAGQWPAALATLRAVQQSGVYALEDGYNKVWTGFPEYWNGKETILAYQATVNTDPNGYNSNWGERLNFPYSGSPFGCCGFHQPSQNLVNFFAVDPATGLPASLSNPNWNADNANFVAGSAKPVDPRLDWTVGRDGVPYKDWGAPNPSWNRDRAFSGPYSPKKNIHEQASVSTSQSTVGWNPQHLNAVKIHIFRYADLLLLLAEAEVEAGSLENARQLVNQVRARAGAKVQGPGTDKASIAVAINDPSITWANYQIGLYPAGSFSSQTYARAAVHAERRLELAMEGQRFFDLKRWGEYQQTLNAYTAVEKNRFPAYFAGVSPVTQRHLFFPIPSQQIELSKVGSTPRLTQNPGW